MSDTPYIYSTFKSNLYQTWFITIVLLLLSYPIVMIGFEKAQTVGWKVLLSFFPLLAVLFIFFSIRDTYKWIQSGKNPLLLEPSSGEIGGTLSGTIFLHDQYEKDTNFTIRLTNIHLYTKRKNQKLDTYDDVLWEDEIVVSVQDIDKKNLLKFSFDIPEGLKESSSFDQQHYYWELTVFYGQTNKQKWRRYIVPVKKGNEKKEKKKTFKKEVFKSEYENAAIYKLIPLQKKPLEYVLHYPPFYHKLALQGLGIFGGIFLSIGLTIVFFNQDFLGFFVGYFLALFGFIFIIYGLYDFLLETYISFDDQHISAKRSIMGIALKTVSFKLDNKVTFSRLNFFRKPIKKGVKERFSFLVIEKDGDSIVLSKYIESIKEQKIVETFFKKLILK